MTKFVLAFALVILAASAGAQDAIMVSMVGTWAGKMQGAGNPDGWVGGDVSFVVTEQKGSAFRGYAEYAKGGGRARDDFVGAIAMDGRTVTTADSNGYTAGFLITPDTLENCYFQSGTNPKVLCGRLRRQ